MQQGVLSGHFKTFESTEFMNINAIFEPVYWRILALWGLLYSWYNALQSGKHILIFRRKVLLPSSCSKSF